MVPVYKLVLINKLGCQARSLIPNDDLPPLLKKD